MSDDVYSTSPESVKTGIFAMIIKSQMRGEKEIVHHLKRDLRTVENMVLENKRLKKREIELSKQVENLKNKLNLLQAKT